MEIGELLAISSEIGNAIRSCISGTRDYGDVIERRERDVTRRIDMVAERALEESLRRKDRCARIISEELATMCIQQGVNHDSHLYLTR